MSLLSQLVEVTQAISIAPASQYKATGNGKYLAQLKKGYYLMNYNDAADMLILTSVLPVMIPDPTAQNAFVELCGFLMETNLFKRVYFKEDNDFVHITMMIPRFTADEDDDKGIIRSFVENQKIMIKKIELLQRFSDMLNYLSLQWRGSAQ